MWMSNLGIARERRIVWGMGGDWVSKKRLGGGNIGNYSDAKYR